MNEIKDWYGFIVFNATFNNISVISWRSFYWCKKLDDPGKPLTCRKSLTNIMLYTSPWSRFEVTTSVVIGTSTDCIDFVNPTTIWSRPRRPQYTMNNNEFSETLFYNIFFLFRAAGHNHRTSGFLGHSVRQ